MFVYGLLIFGLASYVWFIPGADAHSLQRGPYLQSVTADSIWVVWDSISPEKGSVEYGPTRKMGMIVGEDHKTQHHEVKLSGLEPYTTYFYRVGNDKISSFHTAPTSDRNAIRFAIFGDTRSGCRAHSRFPFTRHWAITKMTKRGMLKPIILISSTFLGMSVGTHLIMAKSISFR